MKKSNCTNQEVNRECLVSIVVPVYNVEKFLDDCMESLLAQTIDSYEIILVDDGSTDRSSELCDRYAEKHKRVRVIHQLNKGSSSARNVGIIDARGKYIAFCDSDDKMHFCMLETMVESLERNSADIAICGFETFPNGKVTLSAFPNEKVLNPKELINSCATIHSGNEFCFSWRFMFRNSFLKENELLFDEEISIGEDMLFNTCAVMEAGRIVVVPKALYYYRIDNVNSIMRIKFKPQLEEKLQLQYEKKMKITRKYGLDSNKSWMEDLGYYYITGFAGMLFRNAMNGPEEERKKVIGRAIRLPMLYENYKRCGKRLFTSGMRNTVFRLACMLRIDSIVCYFVKRMY